jgi:hypothetical protein
MAEGSDPQQNITYQAPVGSVDLKAFDEDGNSYEIRACHDCLPRYAEVVVVAGEKSSSRSGIRWDVRSSSNSSGTETGIHCPGSGHTSYR